MAGKSFQFKLITPQGKLLDQPATGTNIPRHDGMAGQLAGHAPFVVKLGLGELRVDLEAGGSRSFVIEGGFAQMVNNRLTVLTSGATPAESLTETEAQAELDGVLAKRPAPGTSPAATAAMDQFRFARERAERKLKLAKSRAGKGI